MALKGGTNSEKIWNYFIDKGFNNYTVAGIIGNLYCESGLNPKNLQNTGNAKLGMSDDEYTKAVDNGTYNNFVNDCHGYGLAQWTYPARCKNLLEFAKSRNKSVGDLETQLNFLYKELTESYKSLLNTLKTAKSVKEASNAFMLKYECPADQSTTAQNKRASYAQNYYDLFVTNSKEKEETRGDTPVGYKNLTKGKTTKLSNNFSSNEFDCHGSGCCSKTLINEELVQYLQKIRDHFGKPITITSAYRCATHNKNVGGATGSRHSKGDAADIVVSGVAPKEVAKYAESIGIKGIGLYETNADGHFTHIDTRTSKSFWYGQAQKYKSTFGGSSSNNNVSSSTSTSNTASSSKPTSNSNVLTVGCSGSKVKTLQKNLISFGYDCGKSKDDGDFGAATKLAVQEFQKEYGGLTVDGKAGKQTLSAIDKAKAAKAFRVKVTANVLNVRSGAGTKYGIVANIKKNSTHLILDEKDGWGKISKGWISSDYYKKL